MFGQNSTVVALQAEIDQLKARLEDAAFLISLAGQALNDQGLRIEDLEDQLLQADAERSYAEYVADQLTAQVERYEITAWYAEQVLGIDVESLHEEAWRAAQADAIGDDPWATAEVTPLWVISPELASQADEMPF